MSCIYRTLKESFIRILFGGVLLAMFFPASGQIYKVNTLSGPNQSPSNTSPGTGSAKVTITNNLMRVETSFNDLEGTTTVAHIHAATAMAGTGTAGVATPTPSFPGFPQGVSSGSYDMTFDMDLASSFSSAYLTANGGTAAGAFSALKNAFNEGKAYFNIHTTTYPGGEIRGFFTQPYQNLSSMQTFGSISEAISNSMLGDTIQQIGDAVENAPVELPQGYIFNFVPPFIFSVLIP
ncbi:MAG: CHRD domain-containing protein [Saprospiraceae bacterium]|nr:CHRD domain-containing protein [Saprospiraceae bacterium]